MVDTGKLKEFRVGDYRGQIKRLIADHTPMLKISTKGGRKKRVKIHIPVR